MLSQEITIIGYATVEDEYKEIFLAQAGQMVALNRREPGCIQSIVLQDMTDNNKFVLHEVWKNREAWTTHLQQKHIADFIEQSSITGKDFQLHKFQQYDM